MHCGKIAILGKKVFESELLSFIEAKSGLDLQRRVAFKRDDQALGG